MGFIGALFIYCSNGEVGMTVESDPVELESNGG